MGSMSGALFADIPLFQEADTVEGNFRDVKCIYRMEDAVFEKEYDVLSGRLGFRSFEKEQIKHLSLGQRRRAELGALFLARPKLLLLDEPSEGLDQIGKDSLRELLLKHFAPDEVMEISFSGKLPDLEDLPLKQYTLQQNKLILTYNANYVTSAELLAHILEQTTITAVITRKSGLADAVTGLAAEGEMAARIKEE